MCVCVRLTLGRDATQLMVIVCLCTCAAPMEMCGVEVCPGGNCSTVAMQAGTQFSKLSVSTCECHAALHWRSAIVPVLPLLTLMVCVCMVALDTATFTAGGGPVYPVVGANASLLQPADATFTKVAPTLRQGCVVEVLVVTNSAVVVVVLMRAPNDHAVVW